MLYMSRWQTLLILSISLFGVVLSLSNIIPDTCLKKMPLWFSSAQITLGLDLKGGSHLLLEADTQSIMHEKTALLRQNLRRKLHEKGIRYRNFAQELSDLSLVLSDKTKASSVANILKDLDSSAQTRITEEKDTVRIHILFPAEEEVKILKNILSRSIETIRQRIDESGTREPIIRQQGENRILIQLPGVQDPNRIKELLGKTGELSFKLVKKIIPIENETHFSRDKNIEILPGNSQKGEKEKILYVVSKDILASGKMLLDAQTTFDENNQPQVLFKFNPIGAQCLAMATQENIGSALAIILDQQVISAPIVRTPILDGSGVIQGRFTIQEAQDLALLMRSGSLPTPLKVLEEKTIGPGLGADSIKSGFFATVLSVSLVIFFIFIIYSSFGAFANLALLFNFFLLISSLGLLDITLTLPGIAGIALTMGMAVDANILINERIREELKRGKKMLRAIDSGYERAFSSIIDSNLTTLIGAALLYICGTGSIKGFAITLSIGIMVSLFTAILLSRVFIIFWIRVFNPKSLSL